MFTSLIETSNYVNYNEIELLDHNIILYSIL